jgi:hypothetical protein
MKTQRQTKSFLLVGALLFGCTPAGVKNQTGSGGSNGSGGSSNSGGSGGSKASGGSNGSGGSNNNSGGSNGSGGSGATDASLDGACAASNVGAQPVPLDLYFLMDSSKSMNDQTGAGTTKWAAVGSALNSFFNDSGSAGLGIALKYFPDEQSGVSATCASDSDCLVGGTDYGHCDYRNTCVGNNASTTAVSPLCLTSSDCSGQNCARIETCNNGASYCAANGTASCPSGCTDFAGYCDKRDICTTSEYATPNVALATLPGAASGLNSSLTGHSPDGYTPTGPALGGAVSWAQQQQTNNPAHKVAIVLVTDGLPGGFIPGFPPQQCAPSDIPTISSNLAKVSGGANPILTFVVGIFNPNSAEGQQAPANLMSLAQAGGTDSAVIIDVTGNTVTQQLHDALAKAQTKAIACSYQIPPSSGGTPVDFTKVNVSFTSGSGQTTTIGNTKDSSACSNGGWYYDVDPSSGKSPTKIIACPSTCSSFQSDTNGEVQIVLGCQTIKIG